MFRRVCPAEHPRLQKYFESVIELYQKMNSINEATQFCNEKTVWTMRITRRIDKILGDVAIDIPSKQPNYHRALNIWEKCGPNNKQEIAKCRTKINARQELSN